MLSSIKNLSRYNFDYFFKMGHSRPTFLYFRLFNTVDSKQFRRLLDSNSGPLVSEANHNHCQQILFLICKLQAVDLLY